MPLGLSVQKGSTGIPPTSPEAAFYRPKHAEQLGKPPHSSVTTRAANQAEGPKDALKDPLESLGLRVSAQTFSLKPKPGILHPHLARRGWRSFLPSTSVLTLLYRVGLFRARGLCCLQLMFALLYFYCSVVLHGVLLPHVLLYILFFARRLDFLPSALICRAIL